MQLKLNIQYTYILGIILGGSLVLFARIIQIMDAQIFFVRDFITCFLQNGELSPKKIYLKFFWDCLLVPLASIMTAACIIQYLNKKRNLQIPMIRAVLILFQLMTSSVLIGLVNYVLFR